MKKNVLNKTLVYVTTLVMITVLFQTMPNTVRAEEPPLPPFEEFGWFIDGNGTYFEITNSSYLNVTLSSSENVHIYLESIPKMIGYYIESNCSANSTMITLSNLEASKNYYFYEDSNLTGQITTDEDGSYSYTSDLTANHLVFIQENTSTVYIKSDGTISPSSAPISRNGNTYTLTGNIYEPIIIQKSSITLDGAGYLVQGPGSNYGIYIVSQNYITIKNIHIKGFAYGIYLWNSWYDTIRDNNISYNQQSAIYYRYSCYNMIKNNTFFKNNFGVYFYDNANAQKYNTISENIFSYNSVGIYLIWDTNQYTTISNNTISHNINWGISFIRNLDSTVKFNTISDNNIGIRLINAHYSRFHHNNIIDNTYQITIDYSSSSLYWNDIYGEGNYWSDYNGLDDGSNGRTAGDGIGDTLIPHPYTDKGNGYYHLDNYPLMDPWGLNDPPVANAGGPYNANEGSTITFDASASTDPNDDPLQYRWDFNNDGTWDTSYSTDPTASYTWYDDYSSTITVEVYDGEETDTATSTITINNIAPTVEAGTDQYINEGEQVTIAPIFIDPGTSDTHIASIDWQDGNPTSIDPANSPLSDIHTYNDNNVYTVTVTVTDDDLGVGTDTMIVTVNDLGPTAIAGNNQVIDESQTINVDGSGSFSSPDIIVLYEWDWTSDGIYDNTGVTATSPQYMDNGVYTVTLRVTDDDGTMDTDILVVTVNDLAPTASYTWSPEPQYEGSIVQFTDSSTSYPDNIVSWSWDFDGLDTSSDQNPIYTFQDNGIYTVTLTVTDEDGSTSSTSSDVTINNVAPIANAGEDKIGVEPSLFTFTGSHTDPGTLDTHTYEWDFDYDGITFNIDATGNNVANTWYDDFDGTVALRVTDDDGGSGIDTCHIIVNNVAPTITSITVTLDPVKVNVSTSASATFIDPGTSDTHTASWNWADGTTSAGTVTETSGSVTGSHIYTSTGVYTVTLTVTDDDGGTTILASIGYIVVYDPSDGFVTGGGWITSPEGAYVPDPTLTGMANFGFVSKYKKGQQQPTGNTEFNFQIADLNFHSNNYDWLVVANYKAMYKGTGTINGEGNYGFILSAIDGQINGGGGVDKFRIKIWDKDDGDTIIYDNNLGNDEDDDPTTILGGGNIKIHNGE